MTTFKFINEIVRGNTAANWRIFLSTSGSLIDLRPLLIASLSSLASDGYGCTHSRKCLQAELVQCSAGQKCFEISTGGNKMSYVSGSAG